MTNTQTPFGTAEPRRLDPPALGVFSPYMDSPSAKTILGQAVAFFVFKLREQQRSTRSAIGGSRSDGWSSSGGNSTNSGNSSIGSSSASGGSGGSGASGTGSGRATRGSFSF